MQRDEKLLGTVINSERSGERDRIISIITPSDGLIRARVYGAQKSSKSIKAPLFSEGIFSIYVPANSNVSLKDADITNIRSEINGDLDRITAATLFSELSLSSRFYDMELYNLLALSLDSLALGIDYKRITIIFIIKFLTLEGSLSDYESCPVCQKVYSKDEILGYNNVVGSSCCQNCSTGEDRLILPPQARHFIRECIIKDFKSIISFNISSQQEDRIFRFMLRLLSAKKENGIKTLSSGIWPLF